MKSSFFAHVFKTVSRKIIGAFGLILLGLTIGFSYLIYQFGSVADIKNRLINLRVPTVFSSARIQADIQESVSLLRGIMLGDVQAR
jgi:hypothetical protein